MTAALEGGEWSAACPGRTLPPGKTQYPFYRRLGGSQGRSGRAEDLVFTGIRPRTFQPVASSYNNLASRPTDYCIQSNIVQWHDMRLNDALREEGSILRSVIFHVAMLLPFIGDSQEEVFYQND